MKVTIAKGGGRAVQARLGDLIIFDSDQIAIMSRYTYTFLDGGQSCCKEHLEDSPYRILPKGTKLVLEVE